MYKAKNPGFFFHQCGSVIRINFVGSYSSKAQQKRAKIINAIANGFGNHASGRGMPTGVKKKDLEEGPHSVRTLTAKEIANKSGTSVRAVE